MRILSRSRFTPVVKRNSLKSRFKLSDRNIRTKLNVHAKQYLIHKSLIKTEKKNDPMEIVNEISLSLNTETYMASLRRPINVMRNQLDNDSK